MGPNPACADVDSGPLRASVEGPGPTALVVAAACLEAGLAIGLLPLVAFGPQLVE